MSTVAYCPNCGKPQPTSANFCQNCGAALRQTPPPAAAPSRQPIPLPAAKPKQKTGCMRLILYALGTVLALSLCVLLARGLSSINLNNTTASRSAATPTRNLAVLQATATPAVQSPQAPVEATGQPSQPTATAAPQAVAIPLPTPTPAPATGPTFAQICGIDEGSVTEVQLKAHADSFVGQTFSNWSALVYDVSERDGRYTVLLAGGPRGFIWSRDIEVSGLPAEIAVPLRVEQPVLLSGLISEVDVTFGAACNPIVVREATLLPGDGGFPLPIPRTDDLSYGNICGLEERNVTEVQLRAYAEAFTGLAISDWQGYVYDVQQRDGRYQVELADGPRGMMWSGNIELLDVPSEIAVPLNVEQSVRVSGRIRKIGTSFGTLCNPITLDEVTISLQ